MVVYKIFSGNYVYIGSTCRPINKRMIEHSYRLTDPKAQKISANSKLYRKLRELGVTRISKDNCEIICEGSTTEEQIEIDKIPMEYSLNSKRSN